ncbi:LysR family transcriptional regulator [Piscinibacter defluvii]|uniref:LysR family transcriptional regulator n=1 Tax=Piscinibacter defluvii TaxID=1796922 RepID=UPI000FDE38A2|nr:LysR family transcriptional regulator [Piscinibacter defluvii]
MAAASPLSVELPALRLALRVAELGSVAAAAREGSLLPATATAAVRRLEAALGVRLFARSSRALRVTAEGEAYLQRVREALALLDLGAGELQSPLQQVRGTLRLAVSTDLGTQVMRPLLDEFLRLHPQLTLELSIGDRLADIGREPVDAAIRYGEPRNAGQILRPLLPGNRRILVASPAYLARAGVPASAADLRRHEGIALRLAGPRHRVWTVHDGHAEITLEPRVRRLVDNGLMARLWALDGLGIAFKSELDVAEDLAAGRLRRVLPSLAMPYPLVLALAPGTHLTARMRALGDFLAARLARPVRAG